MADATGRFGSLRFQSEGRERLRLLELPTNMLGRGPANDIVLDDPSVANRHARLTIEGGRLIVEDLGSGTGTFVDGRPIAPNTPTMVEDEQDVRFGNIAMRFDAPGADADQAAAGAGAAAAGVAAGSAAAPAPEFSPTIRATLVPPAEPLQAGGAPGIARLQVTNSGRVVDQLSISILDLPEDWTRISNPELVLVPGESAEVNLAIQVPRRSDAAAGTYEFSVMIASAETSREVFLSGTVELKPYFDTLLDLRPRRSTKQFQLHVENRGNAPITYAARGRDEDDVLQFEFEAPSVTLEPGETARLPFRVLGKRRLFGRPESFPFKVQITATGDASLTSETAGQLVSQPPLQRFLLPSILLFMIAAGVLGALLVFWPSSDDRAAASDLLSLVHPMCDPDAEPEDDQSGVIVRTGTDRAGDGPDAPVLYAQNDADWGINEYARAQDPDFGPDWCGDTIAQCGCAMTSMANVMSVLHLATMPGGDELSPDTLNAWLNLQAVRDSRGWVSQGYAYGNVIWMAANQLSGQMAEEFGTPTIRFNGWGPGDDAFIRSELEAGRPVVLEIPGHFIAAYGIDQETNAILTYDPYYPDRTTLDYFHSRGIPIRGSRLFEPSDDLSGVMITTPRDVRIKVTRKDTGEEVGTLNTGSADEAADRARVEVEGADYLTAPAWRDPTCTEREPSPEAGVNQLWLPGSIDDYEIEYLNAGDDVPVVAIHSYDKDGNVEILRLESAPTGNIQTFDPDPEVTPTPDPTEPTENPATPATPVTPETPGGGTTPPGSSIDESTSGGGTQPPGGGTQPPAGGTPPGDDTGEPPDTGGGGTTAQAVGAPSLTCDVTYQQQPKLATVDCLGQVAGPFTTTNWAVDGKAAPSSGITFSATFTTNTAITVTFTACNNGECKHSSRAVIVEFPSSTTPPTNGNGGTVTDPSTGQPPGPVAPGINPTCSISYTVNQFATINCLTPVSGAYTSISWSAPGTSNPNQTSLLKTYSTSVPNNDRTHIPVTVTVSACNLGACTSETINLVVRPWYVTTTEWRSPNDEGEILGPPDPYYGFETFYSCVDGGIQYRLEVEVDVPNVPSSLFAQFELGYVQFYVNGQPFGVPQLAVPDSEGTFYLADINWTPFPNNGKGYVLGALFLGTPNLVPNTSVPVVQVVQPCDIEIIEFEFLSISDDGPVVEFSWMVRGGKGSLLELIRTPPGGLVVDTDVLAFSGTSSGEVQDVGFDSDICYDYTLRATSPLGLTDSETLTNVGFGCD